MNHPNLPVFSWVYHTRPSFYRDKVFYDADRTYHQLRVQEQKAAAKLSRKQLLAERKRKRKAKKGKTKAEYKQI